MYLLLPLSLIFVSLIGILAIILRKKSYLNKLHTLNIAGSGETSSLASGFSWKNYGTEFFPELAALINRVEISKYKTHWLTEAEKFLRKTRVVSLKIDRMSDGMIKKIRKIHVNDKLNGHAAQEKIVTEIARKDEGSVSEKGADNKQISPAFLKNEEQRLIIEIAKNPKDFKLYDGLGDLYVEMDNFVDAKESYEAAIELNPQEESLKKKLSSTLEKMTSQN